jgi:hypothetical protein
MQEALLDCKTRAELAFADASRQKREAETTYARLSDTLGISSPEAIRASQALHAASNIKDAALAELLAAERALAAADRRFIQASTFHAVH